MSRRVGLQVYSYDIADEGPEAVVEHASLAAASVLLPQALTEPNLVPRPEDRPEGARDVEIRLGPEGRLPHNPKRENHETDGGAYFQPTEARYPEGLVPRRSLPGSEGEDQLKALQQTAGEQDQLVVPWVILLNQAIAYASPSHCVVNARGEIVDGWFCPNRPETVEFVRALISDVIETLTPPAIFIDRIRFPEWGERGLVDTLTCFCGACQDEATREGVDLEGARAELLTLMEILERDPSVFAERAQTATATPLQALRSLAARGPLLDWLGFRHAAIERVVAEIRSLTTERGVGLWLDVWPPSYAWLLGQDLARLAPYGEWTKPFTYHRVAGGGNIAEFIALVSRDEAVRERVYDLYLSVFGFPGPSTFAEFARQGLHPGFITDETRFAHRMLAGRSKLAAGLQLWQVGPTGVEEALEHAVQAGPDGFFFHCHGWATIDELAAAGDWLRRNGYEGRE